MLSLLRRKGLVGNGRGIHVGRRERAELAAATDASHASFIGEQHRRADTTVRSGVWISAQANQVQMATAFAASSASSGRHHADVGAAADATVSNLIDLHSMDETPAKTLGNLVGLPRDLLEQNLSCWE